MAAGANSRRSVRHAEDEEEGELVHSNDIMYLEKASSKCALLKMKIDLH